MLDFDGSPLQDDHHHRRSRSRSPVSLGYGAETLAEREERRLAETAVPVWPPAGQPGAAPADPEPSTQKPTPTEEMASVAQAASPAAPPPEGAPGAQGAETAAPAGRATAPTDHSRGTCTPLAQGLPPARALSASLGAAAAAAGGKEGAKYRAHTNPSHTHTPPSRTPPMPPSLRGRCGPSAPRYHAAAAAAATGRLARDPGGAGRRAGGAGVPATRARSGGREATGEVPEDGGRGQVRAHAAKSEGQGAGKAPRPAAAEGGRARAGEKATRDTAQGKGKGTARIRAAGGSTQGQTQGCGQGA